MNIAAIALEEKNLAVELPAPLRTSLIRPDFGKAIGPSELGLESSAPKPLSYEVKRGDNLWSICRDCLKDLGQNPSKSELYKVVQSVANANGLKNPDFISIGQTLDLTSARGTVPQTPAPPVIAQAATPIVAKATPSAIAQATPPVIAKATPPAAVITAPNPMPTSSVKTQYAHVAAPVAGKATSTPNGSDRAQAGITPAANAAGGSTAAMLVASQQAVAAKAASAAFGGPDLRVLGATPPLVQANSVERTQVASLPGRTNVGAAETKRPVMRSLMEKIGIGNSESRIGLSSPWRKILDGAARITSGFGVRSDPFTGRLQHHSGLDIAAKRGTRVFPMQDGEVTFSGWKGGYGRMVTVMHDDGLESTYGHNSKNLVNVGDRVTAETPLALVGSTGRSTGPHIHFEVRENGRAIDPVPLLEERSVKISETI